ncbi:xanthine dehydrogenase family protein molybdopterin-binding subunit [Polaromonas sp. Pch-P]|uniref:xanthine dehydrogenase family protein molybdopterin-binding subunit n=2 Tax=unclassified Polaromonas TaxID=2638319 RepID=UPI000F08C8EC|nr:xanthine dehydrogenase family protein molybdopterin-binding subunit [Polaromonas sp. Pch-P]AYQ26804.1 xanthine dehydrogenase family protein molybdopterin-binding subunit [Polaromonas sp. SP1]QGJ18352.1 molybdopterin-dependent oxidoreductase [Polaromonas sp. Pch-P]
MNSHPEPPASPMSARADGLARVEDRRLLTGRGQYVHDLRQPGMLHAVFVRSTHGRARLIAVDLQAAQDSEGVVAVIGPDALAGRFMPPINELVSGMQLPNCPLLAQGRVDSVGQPIALVVATSLQAAQDAAELVFVDYDAEAAQGDMAPGAPPLGKVRHQTSGAAPANVSHRVRVSHQQPRVIAMSLEPRAALAHWDAAGGTLTAWLGTQAPSRARADIARTLDVPLAQVRVIAPDIGGAFGAKASVSPEDLVIAFAARQLKAAIKWTSSRSEEFMSAAQGRGAKLEGELSLDAQGRFLHLEARLQFPMGAWLPYSAVVPARNAARILPGPYRVAAVDIAAEAGMSNAAAVNIYRGAGRPEAALLMERLVEMAARSAGMDPVELRLRNLVEVEAMPYATPTGERFDAGDYRLALQKACARFDYAGERQLQTQRRAAGELVGIGIAIYVEPCGQGWESARVTLHADGRVHVASGSAAQGQGHETSYAVIAAEVLGCEAAQVSVDHGDTATSPEGVGALASRSMAIGGSAVAEAARMAAARRDAGEALPITAGTVYTAPSEGWSYGCVIARMAIDRDTGQPCIERLVWVDDAGRIISPQLAEGQLLGGLAQGLGQAMLERIVYDSEGQLLTGSLMDYAVPRADDMPPIELESLAFTTQANLLGAKGVGEAGCIGVPAALLNAAADALSPLGERSLDFPLTAERLWRAMQPT